MAYEVRLISSARGELKAIRAFDRQRIIADIEAQLADQPLIPTKNRKCLVGASPGFEHVPPVWELRVGEYRVFYDVDADDNVVYVRAVRHKAPEQRTEDIIA